MTLPDTGKLVRSRIPEIISKSGRNPIVRNVEGRDHDEALRLKVLEEAKELANAEVDGALEEVADVYEVLLTIVSRLGVSWSSIVQLAEKKRAERGGFDEGVWLIATE